jgi:hypothetical protein
MMIDRIGTLLGGALVENDRLTAEKRNAHGAEGGPLAERNRA